MQSVTELNLTLILTLTLTVAALATAAPQRETTVQAKPVLVWCDCTAVPTKPEPTKPEPTKPVLTKPHSKQGPYEV